MGFAFEIVFPFRLIPQNQCLNVTTGGRAGGRAGDVVGVTCVKCSHKAFVWMFMEQIKLKLGESLLKRLWIYSKAPAQIWLRSIYDQLPIKRHKRCVNILIYFFLSFLRFRFSATSPNFAVVFNIKWKNITSSLHIFVFCYSFRITIKHKTQWRRDGIRGMWSNVCSTFGGDCFHQWQPVMRWNKRRKNTLFWAGGDIMFHWKYIYINFITPTEGKYKISCFMYLYFEGNSCIGLFFRAGGKFSAEKSFHIFPQCRRLPIVSSILPQFNVVVAKVVKLFAFKSNRKIHWKEMISVHVECHMLHFTFFCQAYW